MLDLLSLLGGTWFVYINLDVTGELQKDDLMVALPTAFTTIDNAREYLRAILDLNPHLEFAGKPEDSFQLFNANRPSIQYNIVRIGRDEHYKIVAPEALSQFRQTVLLPEEPCLYNWQTS